MKLNSYATELCHVNFPAFEGRQKYMYTFPEDLRTITDPLLKVYEGLAEKALSFIPNLKAVHMTVDEKVVKEGWSQRKPGPHVDGRFMPEEMRWSHRPGWAHYCNSIPVDRMPVIVAANVPGCVVYEGVFEGEPKSDGDLSHLDLGRGRLLEANKAYLLSADCIHESIVFDVDTERSFVRFALDLAHS